MFTTAQFPSLSARDAVAQVLRDNLNDQDFVSAAVIAAMPELAPMIPRSHRYVLAPSTSAVERASAAGCESNGAGLIIYNSEHWAATPLDEQTEPDLAIQHSFSISTRTGCHGFGLAPDGVFSGVQPSSCGFDPANALWQKVEWRGIALFDIQAQVLLSDRCAAAQGSVAYAQAVTTVALAIRARRQSTSIVAQLSFRDTPPERMREAVQLLHSVVDGFYIAYPINVGPGCRYCSPANLQQILQAIRVNH